MNTTAAGGLAPRIVSRRSTELDLLEKARTESRFWQTLEEIFGELGFPFYIYLFCRSDGTLFSRTNLRARHYADPRTDPFLKYCCSNTGVTFTGADYTPSYPYLSPEERAFIERASGAGWRCGVAVPVRMRIHREYGGFNLGTRLARGAFEARRLDKVDRLRAICFTAQRRIEELGLTLDTSELERLDRFHALTRREVEIFGLIGEGLSRSEIAERAGISPHTASTHIKTIYRKLGINSQSQAMRLAWTMPGVNEAAINFQG